MICLHNFSDNYIHYNNDFQNYRILNTQSYSQKYNDLPNTASLQTIIQPASLSPQSHINTPTLAKSLNHPETASLITRKTHSPSINQNPKYNITQLRMHRCICALSREKRLYPRGNLICGYYCPANKASTTENQRAIPFIDDDDDTLQAHSNYGRAHDNGPAGLVFRQRNAPESESTLNRPIIGPGFLTLQKN